jgi:hypothetical protein
MKARINSRVNIGQIVPSKPLGVNKKEQVYNEKPVTEPSQKEGFAAPLLFEDQSPTENMTDIYQKYLQSALERKSKMEEEQKSKKSTLDQKTKSPVPLPKTKVSRNSSSASSDSKKIQETSFNEKDEPKPRRGSHRPTSASGLSGSSVTHTSGNLHSALINKPFKTGPYKRGKDSWVLHLSLF